jgi:hypothetical protein
VVAVLLLREALRSNLGLTTGISRGAQTEVFRGMIGVLDLWTWGGGIDLFFRLSQPNLDLKPPTFQLKRPKVGVSSPGIRLDRLLVLTFFSVPSRLSKLLPASAREPRTDILLFFASGTGASAWVSTGVGRAAPLGAEGRWTEDRFRLPGVDPALRVTVEPFVRVLVFEAEVDEARSLEVEEDTTLEVEVDEARSLDVEEDVILEVEVDEARFLEVEEEAILVEVEPPRFCVDIDLILPVSSSLNVLKRHTLKTPSDAHQHTYPPFQLHQSTPIPLHPNQRF